MKKVILFATMTLLLSCKPRTFNDSQAKDFFAPKKSRYLVPAVKQVDGQTGICFYVDQSGTNDASILTPKVLVAKFRHDFADGYSKKEDVGMTLINPNGNYVSTEALRKRLEERVILAKRDQEDTTGLGILAGGVGAAGIAIGVVGTAGVGAVAIIAVGMTAGGTAGNSTSQNAVIATANTKTLLIDTTTHSQKELDANATLDFSQNQKMLDLVLKELKADLADQALNLSQPCPIPGTRPLPF